jgi:hypothetical protein
MVSILSEKRYLISWVVFCSVFFLSFSFVHAERRGKPVTPYGDFCRECGQYGTCDSPMKEDAAAKAMKDYFGKKGYTVEIEKWKGSGKGKRKGRERFIKAKVKDKDIVVDVIIFDRRTGRMRSIY